MSSYNFTIPSLPAEDYEWLEKNRKRFKLDDARWREQWVFVVAGLRALRALSKKDPDAATKLINEVALEKRT